MNQRRKLIGTALLVAGLLLIYLGQSRWGVAGVVWPLVALTLIIVGSRFNRKGSEVSAKQGTRDEEEASLSDAHAPMPEAPAETPFVRQLDWIRAYGIYLVAALTGVVLGLGWFGWSRWVFPILLALWAPAMIAFIRARGPRTTGWAMRADPRKFLPVLVMVLAMYVAQALRPQQPVPHRHASPTPSPPRPTCVDLLAQLPDKHADWSVPWSRPATGMESTEVLMSPLRSTLQGAAALEALRQLGPGMPKNTVAVASTGPGARSNGLVVMQFASQGDADVMVRWIVRSTCVGYDDSHGDDAYGSTHEGTYIRMIERGPWVAVSFAADAATAGSLIWHASRA